LAGDSERQNLIVGDAHNSRVKNRNDEDGHRHQEEIRDGRVRQGVPRDAGPLPQTPGAAVSRYGLLISSSDPRGQHGADLRATYGFPLMLLAVPGGTLISRIFEIPGIGAISTPPAFLAR
jgi:hypothetical protein